MNVEKWNYPDYPRLIDVLKDEPKTWRELVSIFPKGTLSRRLKPLMREGFVKQLPDGRYATFNYSAIIQRMLESLRGKTLSPVSHSLKD